MTCGAPDDWDVKSLSALAFRITVGIASAATFAYRSEGVPMFRNQNIKEGRLDDSDLLFLEPSYEIRYRNKRLQPGDLLTARTGYPGTTALVPPQYRAAQSFTTLITRPDPNAVDSAYLCYFMNSSLGKAFVEQSQIGGAQKNFNAESLRRMPVWLPAEREQKAITAALSDVDKLLLTLERQIAKKRAIQQGMIQELLTGRTRLPGFDGEWIHARLGSVLKVKNGRSQRDIESATGRYPILATGGEIGRTDTPIYTKPSVLIGRKGTINRPQFRESPFWTVDTLFYTEISSVVDARFLYYLCTAIDWALLNEATGVPSLTGARIESVEVLLPRRDEQYAIARVIRDADDEIEALERRFESTRAIKRGMMQELLTGRTRLVVKEDSA